jgi:hypothetical protein
MRAASKIAIVCLPLFGWSQKIQCVPLDLPYSASPESAYEIMKHVYYVNHFYSFKNLVIKGKKSNSLEIINLSPDHNISRMSAQRFVRHNFSNKKIKTKDLLIIKTGKLKGTGLLATDYIDDKLPIKISLWLPALRKIRRISEPDHSDKWASTVLTNGDVYLREPEDESHSIVTTEVIENCLQSLSLLNVKSTNFFNIPDPDCSVINRETYVIKSTPNNQESWYDYRLTWVDKLSYSDYITEFYDEGKRIKLMTKSWHKINNYNDPRAQVWNYWYGYSDITGQQSFAKLPMDSITIDANIKESFWNESRLKKIKR